MIQKTLQSVETIRGLRSVFANQRCPHFSFFYKAFTKSRNANMSANQSVCLLKCPLIREFTVFLSQSKIWGFFGIFNLIVSRIFDNAKVSLVNIANFASKICGFLEFFNVVFSQIFDHAKGKILSRKFLPNKVLSIRLDIISYNQRCVCVIH